VGGAERHAVAVKHTVNRACSMRPGQLSVVFCPFATGRPIWHWGRAAYAGFLFHPLE
jgi:hypothetical protein